VKCESQFASPDKKLYLYASNQLLPVKGSFKCTMGVCDTSTRAEVLGYLPFTWENRKFQLENQMDINPTVKPVTQPYRRILFNLREQVQDIKALKDL